MGQSKMRTDIFVTTASNEWKRLCSRSNRVVVALHWNSVMCENGRYRSTREQESRKSLSLEDMCDISRLPLYHVLCNKTELQRLHEQLRKPRISLHVSPTRPGAAWRGAMWNFSDDSVRSAYGATTGFLRRDSFVTACTRVVRACVAPLIVAVNEAYFRISSREWLFSHFHARDAPRAGVTFSRSLFYRRINLVVVNKNPLLFFLSHFMRCTWNARL